MSSPSKTVAAQQHPSQSLTAQEYVRRRAAHVADAAASARNREELKAKGRAWRGWEQPSARRPFLLTSPSHPFETHAKGRGGCRRMTVLLTARWEAEEFEIAGRHPLEGELEYQGRLVTAGARL